MHTTRSWSKGIFFFSFLFCVCLFSAPRQKYYIENQISHLFLEQISTLSPSERMWIQKHDIQYKKLLTYTKGLSDKKEEFEKIEKLSHKLPLPTSGVPFIGGSLRKQRKDPSVLSFNDVVSSSQRYIISEAPRPETVKSFWKTLFDNDVKVVITLVSPLEEKKKNLSLFWQKENFPLFVGEWKIDAIGEGLIEKNHKDSKKQIISRLFLAHNTTTNQTRVIQQLHYLNWPDVGRPEIPLLERLISLTIQLNPDRETPLFVHCAAGIGRAGTFVTAHSLCKDLWDMKNRTHFKRTAFNIPEKLILLRMQRPSLVSTGGQYEAIYQTLGCFAHRMKKDHLLSVK